MNRAEIARVLDDIATLGEFAGESPFRTRAFANAARVVETTDADLETLAREGELTRLRGVGEGIAAVVGELIETGHSRMHEELRSTTPAGLHDLLRIPGLGAKRVGLLSRELGIDSLDALEVAARSGRIAGVSGFGAKTEQKILEGIAFVRSTRGRRPLSRRAGGRGAAARLVAVAARGWRRPRSREPCAVALRWSMRWSLSPPRPSRSEPSRHSAMPSAGRASDLQSTGELRLSDGLPVRLHCVEPGSFVPAMVWATGSEAHLQGLGERAEVLGMRFDREGLWRDGEPIIAPIESAFYAELGLSYIPPELREGIGEIEAAARGALPHLVSTEDLRGTFHCHTTYSDGKATLEEMAEGARARDGAILGWGTTPAPPPTRAGFRRRRSASSIGKSMRGTANVGRMPGSGSGRGSSPTFSRTAASIIRTRCWRASTMCSARCTPASACPSGK